MINKEWEDRFFTPELLDSGVGDSDSIAVVDYYLKLAGTTGRSILDIGCGTGRVSIPLAEAGHTVWAVDSCPEMVQWLERKLQTMPEKVRARISISLGRLAELSFKKPVDIAFAVDDLLTLHLSPESLRHFFLKVRTWLRKGGLFAADVRQRSTKRIADAQLSFTKSLQTFGVVEGVETCAGPRTVATYFWKVLDSETRQLTTINCYHVINPDGNMERVYYRRLRQRLHTNEEILALAKDCGFEVRRHGKRGEPWLPPLGQLGGSFEFTAV